VFCLNLTNSDGDNLLIGNHYFPPDVLPDTLFNYFFLENKLDTKYYWSILLAVYKFPVFNGNAGYRLCLIFIQGCIVHIRAGGDAPSIFPNV
jgi:hypothetical protein